MLLVLLLLLLLPLLGIFQRDLTGEGEILRNNVGASVTRGLAKHRIHVGNVVRIWGRRRNRLVLGKVYICQLSHFLSLIGLLSFLLIDCPELRWSMHFKLLIVDVCGEVIGRIIILHLNQILVLFR